MYVKAGLEKDKAAMLVVLAGLRDGRKVLLAVESGYRESTESWAAILRDLKRRGLATPRLVIGDGHLGIWGALAAVFPEAKEQRCWNHRLLNILGQAAADAAGGSAEFAHQDPVCGDARGRRAAEASVPGLVREARSRRGGARPRARLGADGDLL